MLADNMNERKEVEKELLNQAKTVSKTKRAIIRASLGINPCLTTKELEEID
jgi:hypothetical protein